MFRITEQRAGGQLVLKLEGRCAGPWVSELDGCWRAAEGAAEPAPIVVDLTGVCSVDAAGREQLARMSRAGAQFVASGCAMRELVHEIAAGFQLPASSGRPDADEAGAVDLEVPRSTRQRGLARCRHANAEPGTLNPEP